MSLEQLQTTIDASIAGSKGFSRELFTDNHLDARQLQEYINGEGSIALATLDSEGKPHSAVTAAACADGTIHFGVTPHTALLGNLRRSPDVAFAVKDKVVGQGQARLIGRARDQKDLAPSLGPILGTAVEQDWGGYIYALELSKVFAVP
jgi:pyridoxamine 5'-phosphate oxidase-like protein